MGSRPPGALRILARHPQGGVHVGRGQRNRVGRCLPTDRGSDRIGCECRARQDSCSAGSGMAAPHRHDAPRQPMALWGKRGRSDDARHATEVLAGRGRVAIVLLVSFVSGSFLSMVLLPATTSVGASGGRMGLLGFLIVLGIRYKPVLPREFVRSLVKGALWVAVAGLVAHAYIDNAAHAGGFLGGLGVGLGPRPLQGDPASWRWTLHSGRRVGGVFRPSSGGVRERGAGSEVDLTRCPVVPRGKPADIPRSRHRGLTIPSSSSLPGMLPTCSPTSNDM